MKAFHVLLMPGEGIGLEIVTAGEKVLRAAASMFDLKIDITIHTVGLPMFEQIGQYMSEETVRLCEDLKTRSNAAILFGAVADEPLGILRKKYDFFLNLRPIRLFSGINTSPLKVDRIQRVDMLIVRELVSGIYYGTARQGKDDTGQWAGQEMFYHESEIRRITLRAFELARQRRKRLHMVHKGNVISGVFNLWLNVLNEVGKQFPDVTYSDILVDNIAMQMVLNPVKFDVVLCSNLFGDILSDLGAGIIGSIGLLPSASLNEHGFGLFESVGGTAPDIAGKQEANPLSTILSVAMMCRHTFRHEKAASTIETAVAGVLNKYRTPDILDDGYRTVSTSEMGAKVISAMEENDENLESNRA